MVSHGRGKSSFMRNLVGVVSAFHVQGTIIAWTLYRPQIGLHVSCSGTCKDYESWCEKMPILDTMCKGKEQSRGFIWHNILNTSFCKGDWNNDNGLLVW